MVMALKCGGRIIHPFYYCSWTGIEGDVDSDSRPTYEVEIIEDDEIEPVILEVSETRAHHVSDGKVEIRANVRFLQCFTPSQ